MSQTGPKNILLQDLGTRDGECKINERGKGEC